MTSSQRCFAMVAMIGLTVFALAQTPAHAQFRPAPVRPVPVVPVFPPVVRRPIVVPPVNSFVNPYVLPGMTLNQLATYNVLSQNLTLAPLLYRYANPYVKLYGTPYLGVPYSPTILPYTRIGVPGLPYNPYNFYNPYFASFGYYP